MTIATTPAPGALPAAGTGAHLAADDTARIAAALDAAYAETTRKVYAFAWSQWDSWCHDRSITKLPAEPATVCAYLTDRAHRAASLATITGRDVRVLNGFVSGLPERFSALSECGIPQTLVHGDFHPGNARRDGEQITLLDWGDCGLGHPLLDQTAFTDRLASELVSPVVGHWCRLWRQAVPGSDPERAVELLTPLADARQAVVYQGFLDRIEPSEHPYHRDDPAQWLARAAQHVTAFP